MGNIIQIGFDIVSATVNPQIFFFLIWAQLTLIILFRGAIYGDIARDMPTELRVWQFYREDTSIATRLLLPCVVSWIIMWLMPLEIVL